MRPVALVFLALVACQKHPGAYETATPTNSGADDAVSARLAEADALWAERADAAKLEQALGIYEEVHGTDPANRHALVRLTRGWYFFGDGHAPDEGVQIERWATAIEWGAKCMALNEEFAKQVNSGAKEKDAVAVATKDDVPCLYWTATALGKWAKAQSLSKTLRFLPTVKAYIGKVEELQPDYFHYGPARYWGAYYAALPSFAGQDFEKSAQYFEASIEGAPYYLPTRVLRAELLAVGTQDLSLFQTDLETVMNGDPDQRPEADVTAENEIERLRAKTLLAKKSELFDRKVVEASTASE